MIDQPNKTNLAESLAFLSRKLTNVAHEIAEISKKQEQSRKMTECLFCGKLYPKAGTRNVSIAAHLVECKKHPYAKLLKKYEKLQKETKRIGAENLRLLAQSRGIK